MEETKETVARPGGAIHAGETPEAAGLDARFWRRSLFAALARRADGKGGAAIALEDRERAPLSAGRLLLAATVLGARLARLTVRSRPVGVLLPNVNGAAIAFFALSAYGRVPAMLNFTAGAKNLVAALQLARVSCIVTSRRFIAEAKLEELAVELEKHARLLFLEDVRRDLTLADKLKGALYAKFPQLLEPLLCGRQADDVAVVLFTSGTEGAPKGVALSSANILANIAQILAIYPFGKDDVVFNALPVFHSFGLTAGLLLPLLGGFKSFLYPSPLHYKQIPELVRTSRTSILLSTDTFLNGWLKSAAEADFAAVRFTVLGAERVKEQTRLLWGQRFSVSLNEGYGVTETAPVLAVNRPGAERAGTVGKLLPGIEARLEPVPGLAQGGRLFVRGPNVMRGYYRIDAPGVLQPLPDGWHDTGDIVSIDADGFLTIRGRAKRFAKIGGEMVSLAAIEAHVAALWPEASHAVVAVSDARKGEALVLVTDAREATREALFDHAKAQGLPELMIPRKLVHLESLPVLGTGKLDLVGIEALARAAES